MEPTKDWCWQNAENVNVANEKTVGEVENWTVISLPDVSWTSVSKVPKIVQFFFKLQGTRQRLQLRQLLCICQHVTTTSPRSAFWGIFDPTMTLTSWPQNLMCSSLPQSPLVVKVWSNSVNKYQRYLANNVCSGLAHARINEHSGNTMPSATTLANT